MDIQHTMKQKEHFVLVREQVDKEVNLWGNEKVLKDCILETSTFFELFMDDLLCLIYIWNP